MSNIYTETRLGDDKIHYLYPRSDSNMRLPYEIRQCVVFLGLPNRNGKPTYGGTGFIVALEAKIDRTKVFQYLVTARHNVQHLEGREFIIGINSVDGGSNFIEGNGAEKWWYHPYDNSVDAAILPINLSRKQFEFSEISVDKMLNIDKDTIVKKGIGTGDEVFITGLFTRFSGSQKNIPIVRVGNIAMMPDERIWLDDKFGESEVYLIESRSLGGLSGSPVFVCDHRLVEGKIPIYLLGLIKGHWNLKDGESMDSATSGDGEGINTGIAIVVPTKKIVEIINQPRLIEMRKQIEEKLLGKHAATMDWNGSKEDGITQDKFHSLLNKASKPIKKEEPKSD